MLKFFKQLFCKHNYKKVGFRQEVERGIRYSVRNYKCNKCGKSIWVDGRDDYLECQEGANND